MIAARGVRRGVRRGSRHSFATAALGALLALAAAGAKAPPPAAPPPAAPASPAAPTPASRTPVARAAILAAINHERAAFHARPLALSKDLDRVAQARAAEIARRGVLPSPEDSGDLYAIDHLIVATGYRPQGWTESLTVAVGDAASVMAYWKAGDSFLAAMSRDYADLGVGVAMVKGVPVYAFLFAWPQREVYARQVSGLGDLIAVRKEMFARVNALRAGANLAPLTDDPRLDTAAQKHADDMLARHFYSHLTPEGLNPRDRIEDAGFFSPLVAENIAEGEFSVADVVDGWMRSEAHRANILDPRMTTLGVGLAVGRFEDRLRILWVQELARQGP